MRLVTIFEKAKTAATQVRQILIYDQEQENRRSQIILQVLIGAGLAVLGFLLGFFM
jgi:hypothetical protein